MSWVTTTESLNLQKIISKTMSTDAFLKRNLLVLNYFEVDFT